MPIKKSKTTKRIDKKKSRIQIHTPGSKAKLWFILPDVHFGEHDETAVALALKAQAELKPDFTLLLGDLLDCGLFSAHPKKTIHENQAYDYKAREVDPANSFLDEVQSNTKTWTYFLEGNHENRIERWAANTGRVTESLYPLLSPKHTLIEAPKREKITMVPYQVLDGSRMGYVQIVPNLKKMKSNGLVAVHGFSYCKMASRKHLELSRSQSIIFGHTHRMQLDVSRDPWSSKPIKAFSPGCLSKLQPLYIHGGSPTEWSHGFALVYVGDHSWTEYLVNIVRGSCVFPDGREIKI